MTAPPAALRTVGKIESDRGRSLLPEMCDGYQTKETLQDEMTVTGQPAEHTENSPFLRRSAMGAMASHLL